MSSRELARLSVLTSLLPLPTDTSKTYLYRPGSGFVEYVAPTGNTAYRSAPTTWTVNGELTFNHGLGVVPSVVSLFGVVTQASQGFAVGRIFTVHADNANSAILGAQITGITDTTITVRCASLLTILLTANTQATFDPSTCQLLVRALP